MCYSYSLLIIFLKQMVNSSVNSQLWLFSIDSGSLVIILSFIFLKILFLSLSAILEFELGLVLATQVLYHLSHASSPFL
jgi:hypothetical protein